MKLIQELNTLNERRGKAGCIPYVLDANGEPRMAFMISSDANFGGPDPMIAKGGIDEGESPEQAGVREAQEELGLRTTNIVDGTLTLGWQGQLRGMDSTYDFHVFTCQVDDVLDFDKPDFETEEVVWMTAEEFMHRGRDTQRHIVLACLEKIKEMANG